MQEGNRIAGFDGLKGITVVGIVFSHLVLLSGINREGGDEMPLVMQAIYLGLTSFLIITGYFYKPGRGFTGNIKSRMPLLIALTLSALTFPMIIYAWAPLFGQSRGWMTYSQPYFRDLNCAVRSRIYPSSWTPPVSL